MKTLPFIMCMMSLVSVVQGADSATLIRLYEEEVLAHDLYVALGKSYPDVMPLQNIPHSEMRHQQAMAGVLEAAGIALPNAPQGRRFVSAGLDETFEKWLSEGMKSAVDACRAGVRLEDHDIAELRKAQMDFPDHKEVLGQLEAASNNHLRAFSRNMTARGGKYTPEALTEKDFKLILDGGGKAFGGCKSLCQPAGKESAKGTCGKRPGKKSGSKDGSKK